MDKETRYAAPKAYEELDFSDNFLFCKIMTTRPDLCRELLELILGRKIGKITYLNDQEEIQIIPNAKGVRFDVDVLDDMDEEFDVEMETISSRKKLLPKRSRYYQSMLDLNQLEKGESYRKLKKSYVIFICTFDAFCHGLHKYSFSNVCAEDPGIQFGDETATIFLCTGGTTDDVSDDMKDFLDYLTKKQGTEKPAL